MKTSLKALALIGVSGLFSTSAFADSGFYLGAAIGQAQLDDDFDGLTVDDDSTSYRLFGGWQFNEFVSVEAGYHDFGDFEERITIDGVTSDVSLSADGFTLGANGSLPINDAFSLTGRAGWFFWDGDAEINSVSQASPDDTNLYFGLGANYEFADSFSVQADWTQYELEDTDSDVVSVGFKYRFGGF